MLCPKCGYISFDHLTSCQKCDNDLTIISADLRGTSAQVDLYSFLNGVLREPIVESDPSLAEGVGDVLVVDDEVIEVSGDIEAEGSDAAGDGDVLELTVDLDEMAPLDLDSIGNEGADGGVDESALADVELEIDGLEEIGAVDGEEPALELDDVEGGEELSLDGEIELSEDPLEGIELEIPDVALEVDGVDELPDEQGDEEMSADTDKDVAGGETLEIDPGSLSLYLDDIAVETGTEDADTPQHEKAEDELTLDLDQIDLSDLVDDFAKKDSGEEEDDLAVVGEEAPSELPQDEIVLTLEDVENDGEGGNDDLLAVEDNSDDEVLLDLDDLSGTGSAGDDSAGMLDLSLETDNDDAVIESLTDIIDLSLENEKK